MDRVFSASEARANFSELVTEAGYADPEAIIEHNNRPIMVIFGYEQYLELRRQAGERVARLAIHDEIRTRDAEATPEQVEADVADAVRAVRQS
jgi:prevent-host-death family protein